MRKLPNIFSQSRVAPAIAREANTLKKGKYDTVNVRSKHNCHGPDRVQTRAREGSDGFHHGGSDRRPAPEASAPVGGFRRARAHLPRPGESARETRPLLRTGRRHPCPRGRDFPSSERGGWGCAVMQTGRRFGGEAAQRPRPDPRKARCPPAAAPLFFLLWNPPSFVTFSK